jgi:hypothetical protein
MKMKSKLAIALLIAGLLSIGAWSGYGQTGKERNVTYEYAVVEASVALGPDEEMKMLNKFGAQGWEIVGISQPANAQPRIYLKRTIK